MDDGTEDVKQNGSLFIVDPNPPGRDMIPPEDMFIYVKFSATPRSRFIYGGNSGGIENGVEDAVDFISTKIKYNPEGELTPKPQKTYATTSWTNIGGLQPTDSRGVLEGFGIKSIDIKYNASLVPVVDITFTDVRGAGLFDTIKDKSRKSPYSVFFKMPYPIFNLSVKGYFGQSIDYCLHMVNWSSNFDGTTGNFDISANFLGFQQAFLNDMNIGNIIGTVNTELGFKNLNNIFDKQEADSEKLKLTLGAEDFKSIIDGEKDNSVRKIDDFFTKIAKLQIDTEVLKAQTDELDKLKQINGQLSLLKSIRSFIGSAISKTSDVNNDGEITEDEIKERKGFTDKNGDFIKPTKTYYELYNQKQKIITSEIKDNTLSRGKNYLSIRDYLLINSTQEASFKAYMETLNDIIKQYDKYVREFKSEKGEGEEIIDDTAMLKSFKFTNLEQPDSENYWKEFVVKLDDDLNPKPEKLKDVLDNMSDINDDLSLSETYENSPTETNVKFNMVNFTNKKGSSFYTKGGLTKDSNVYVVDFREIRDRVAGTIDELRKISKIESDKVEEILNKKILLNFQEELGFKPTISNCFRIIANNTEAMTTTIYEISKKAQEDGLKDERKDVLEGKQTDVPKEITASVAWPSVYVNNDKDGLEEVYLGDEEYFPESKSSFPEIEFVEKVFKVLVQKTKSLEQTSRASVLKNGLDTDNWLPINPIDYKINPWIIFTGINDEKEMDSFIAKSLFNRVAVLKEYSRWSEPRTLSRFAGLDGIAANKAFITQDTRNIYKDRLVKLGSNLMSTGFGKGSLEESAGVFTYINEEPTSISGVKIGGTRFNDVDYILFDDTSGIDTKKILFNTKKLTTEIKTNSRYTTIKLDEGTSKSAKYYSEDFRNGNINTYLGYNVWDQSVSDELKGEDSGYSNFKINSLASIDLTGGTSEGKFLNKTNFVYDTDCAYPEFLIQSDFYEGQTDYAKGLLLLSTLPFKTFKEAVLDVAFPQSYSNAKILHLPKYYIYLIGGYLWNNKNNGIKWNINFSGNTNCPYNIFETPAGEYLTKIGYMSQVEPKVSGGIKLETQLTQMPAQTIDSFIKKFQLWVDNGLFKSFETDMATYQSPTPIAPTLVTSSTADIKQQLSSLSNMIVLAPGIFDKSLKENLTARKSDINKYIEGFLQTYVDLEDGTNETSDEISEEEKNASTVKIKLQIYNYFKNINDKWVSDTEKCFNACSAPGGDKSLYDYFKFIDRGWNDIGSEATINLSSFLTLGSNLQTSVYFFMSKLLRDSNFLLQILPTYIDFKTPSEVSKIFKPVTTIKNSSGSGPIYCGIYIGGASKALDIGEDATYAHANDGFSLDFPTPDMVNDGGNSLVAFRVGFGAENQTIFKNVSLNQQEHKETGEYFKALSELVDKRGGTQKVYQGTDLLKLFKTRSYTCKVDALGCMNIQPLMYFNLENVPFFNGAYLITSVNHSISPNHMTTNFTGVRQSKYITKFNSKVVADLNLNLNETNEIPKLEFTNRLTTNPIWKIGVKSPQDGFEFNTKWKVSKFEEMGVDFNNVKGLESKTDDEIQTILDLVKKEMDAYEIVTNSQVCMFVANVMVQSNYLANEESTLSKGDLKRAEFPKIGPNVTIYSGATRIYGDTTTQKPANYPFNDELLDTLVNNPSGILNSTPTFTAETADDIAWVSKTSSEYEEHQTFQAYRAEANKIDTDPFSVIASSLNFQKQLSGLTYYNIYPGDGWRFKPRGYLHVTGRREYFEYGDDYLKSPDKIVSSFLESFKAAMHVWKTKKPNSEETLKGPYKNSYEAAGGDGTDKKRNGSSSDFTLTNEISCEPDTAIGESFDAFESVLLAFNLKDEFNPV